MLGVLMAASGCAPGDEAAAPTAASPAAASPVSSDEERALEAYRGLMGAVVEGSHEGATDHPDLAWYAKGQALTLAEDWLNGIRATGEPDLAPEVAEVRLSANPPRVVIEDCVDGSDWSVVEEDLGAVEELSDSEAPRPFTATVTKEDGTWQVEKLWIGDHGACER
ncbi:hypothetical protein ACFPZ0_11240 [Streptomonospora nanhaiensis]|uniref:hypothetical protein n=1 Tax=Streptomonospora nanhaiensis TaxID=1323731 RepID=UPI0027DF134C|nr:hypothetical protein [Streptomonospora nanhaiensis]